MGLLNKANNGDVNAIHKLGILYDKGNVTKINIYMAKYFYKKVADKGSEDEKQKYTDLINDFNERD